MRVDEGFFDGCDGTRLFYRAAGEGPDMVACNGIGVSTFFWKRWEAHFRGRFRFVTWDYRGHGRSDPPKDPARVDMETLADDLHRLAAHIEMSRPIVFGHSMGVQVALEYYRRYREQVGALVPVLGSYGKPADTFLDFRYSRPVFDLMIKAAKRNPKVASHIHRMVFDPRYAITGSGIIGLIDRLYCPAEAMRDYFTHISSLDTMMLLAMGQHMADHSARDVLGSVTVPVLIVAGEKDLLTPIHLSLEMQRLIPGAELLFVRDGTHTSLIEQPSVILAGLDGFLARHDLEPGTAQAEDIAASAPA